jgi:hypothetical protein
MVQALLSLQAVPGKAVPPGTPAQSLAAAAETLKLLLVPIVNVIPDVAVAVRVTPVPEPDNTTPLMTTDDEPEVMVPVVEPVKVPALPLVVNVTKVLEVAFFWVPFKSTAFTVTEKDTPCVCGVEILEKLKAAGVQ